MSNPINKEIDIPKAVNWHCEAYCNYGCKFCYASFEIQRTLPRLSEEEGFALIKQLVDAGVEKINFVGGEPMLHRHIKAWIKYAKELNLTTSIVSNGTRMTPEFLEEMSTHLDWLGLSIDASNDELHALMGRGLRGEINDGFSNHLERSKRIIEYAKKLGYGIKLNTVVCSVNLDDDMQDLVRWIAPNRWKIFQVLKIEGENDGRVEALLVSDHNFEEYIERHVSSLSSTSIQVVPENNEAMLGTYAMIDALGRVYTNKDGFYRYSKGTVQENGFAHCWSEVCPGFSHEAFNARGGEWDWEMSTGVAL